MTTAPGDFQHLPLEGLDALIVLLRARGYTVIGPVVSGGAIVLGEITGDGDLPAGWTDEQGAGTYRLRARDDSARFGHVVGPDSLKRFTLPPSLHVFSARCGPDGELTVESHEPEPRRLAFLGVRSCDLHATGILGTVLRSGVAPSATADETLVIAVQCGESGGTCFCTSMGTGPRAESGFDLALTEVLDDGGHWFGVEVGSPAGAELLAELPVRPATGPEAQAARERPEAAAAQMGRTLDTTDLRDLLLGNLEHPRWEQVADRCLSCANCTLACPTCFCVEVADTGDAAGRTAEREQRWASCFTVDHSHMHGGSVRATTSSRYRQWMTHKLATWFDQFGSSGCVGCGRCITWCPAAIDITEEVGAIRATDGREGAA